MKHFSVLNPPHLNEKVNKITWGELHDSSVPLLIINLAKKSNQPFVIITENNQQGMQLEEELGFFAKKLTPKLNIAYFPDWETLPYDHFSPHQDIISQRLKLLSRLKSMQTGIVIISITTLMQRLPPPSFLLGHSLSIEIKQTLNLDQFRESLQAGGYQFVSQVREHGECAIRGSLIDLFPMGSKLPCRIDLFDNEIESIRYFDPETQRSIKKIDQIDCLPAHEFPLTETAINHFRKKWRNTFSADPTSSSIYQDVSRGIASPGIEYYLPLFFDQCATFFDYLSEETVFFLVDHKGNIADQFWSEIKERYQQLSHDILRPILAPNEIYCPSADLYTALNNFQQVKLQAQPTAVNDHYHGNFASQAAPPLLIEHRHKQPLDHLLSYLNEAQSRILFCTESIGRREIILELLQGIAIRPDIFNDWDGFINSDAKYGITHGPLSTGLVLPDEKIEIIVEAQLFGDQVSQRRLRKAQGPSHEIFVRDLTELHIGDAIVHISHGIGRYQGLKTIAIDGYESEFLILEYAGNDRIYVPVTALNLINRYTGVDQAHITLNKLGSDQWAKHKAKAAAQIRDVAAELLDLYAQRQAKQGFQYQPPDLSYQNFASTFPFEETADQRRAIEEVLADMKSKQPMDRLICGDVGFGKTEVALRAAYLAVQNGKQVAILVPTTLLAEQHFKNFNDRLVEFAVNVAILSRFRSSKQQKQILADLKDGKIDLIIGTHKLIQKNIVFKELGLIIIDEEHRFGVRQKEHLKSLRTEVDILSLTATPIPRTLNMALSAICDISIISTPPAKRLSIKTFCQQKNKQIIREAMLREIMRGGQVFYLHNKVSTIDNIAQELMNLLPEAKIAIAHGQMRESELEIVMRDFYHRRFNVLVCTTIIENGIDIPTANTIIIDRADRFGLAQLHQLRGRVGRSHHQAYAYLLIPDQKSLTKDAQKRLDAIMSLEDLGAGYLLATHDLEIRGCGELLGENQSGHIQSIGFSLYMDLLDRAVKALKSGKEPALDQPLTQGPEMSLQISTIIPEDYIADVNTRLILYKRISNANSTSQLDDLQVEMVDRFGLLPQQIKHLFKVTQLKLQGEKLGILRIEANSTYGRIEFTDNPNVNPEKLIQLVKNNPQKYQFSGPQCLRFNLETEEAEQRIKLLASILKSLSEQ